ncbi:MAG: hypothetical protein PVI30_03550 [Myxococcales bacterium]
MLKSRLLLTGAVMALALSFTQSAFANARRPGMAGNLLIEDTDDVYAFPHLVSKYRNLLALTMGGSGDSGNGLLTLGHGDLTYGVGVHRGDVQNPHIGKASAPPQFVVDQLAMQGLMLGDPNQNELLGHLLIDDLATNELAALNGPTSFFGGLPSINANPATVFDLWLSTGDLGFRLTFGSGALIATANDEDTGSNDTFMMAEVGYGSGTRGETARVDFSGALAYDFASAAVNDAATASGHRFQLSGLLRSYFPVDSTLDLGVLAKARVANRSLTNESVPDDPTSSTLTFGLAGGVGPAFRFGAAQVAGYGVLRVGVGSIDPNDQADGDEVSTLDVVIPGVHMATEVPLNDWLFFRAGADYSFRMIGSSDDDDDGVTLRYGTFGWNAGLGARVGSLQFDGSVQQGFVTGGPDFIGGTAPGFLAIASATYSFDDLRSGARPVSEPEPEPAPVAEPAPLAPAPPPAAPEPEPPAPVEAEGSAQGGGWIRAGGSAEAGAGASTEPAPAEPAPAAAPQAAPQNP